MPARCAGRGQRRKDRLRNRVAARNCERKRAWSDRVGMRRQSVSTFSPSYLPCGPRPRHIACQIALDVGDQVEQRVVQPRKSAAVPPVEQPLRLEPLVVQVDRPLHAHLGSAHQVEDRIQDVGSAPSRVIMIQQERGRREREQLARGDFVQRQEVRLGQAAPAAPTAAGSAAASPSVPARRCTRSVPTGAGEHQVRHIVAAREILKLPAA